MRELGASPSHRMTQGNLACPLGNGEVRPAPRGCPAQRAPRNEKRLSPRCLAQTPGTKPLLNDNDKRHIFFCIIMSQHTIALVFYPKGH